MCTVPTCTPHTNLELFSYLCLPSSFLDHFLDHRAHNIYLFTSYWTQCEMFSILVGLDSFSFYQRRMLNQPYHPIQQVQWELKASLSYLHWCLPLTMDFHKCTVTKMHSRIEGGETMHRTEYTISTQETTRKTDHLAMPPQKERRCDWNRSFEDTKSMIDLPHNIA